MTLREWWMRFHADPQPKPPPASPAPAQPPAPKGPGLVARCNAFVDRAFAPLDRLLRR